MKAYHSWVAALRIARRDAWRAKGRSSLVLAMIALPIIGVSGADLTLRSAQLSPAETVARRMGAADAVLTSSGRGAPVHQKPDGGGFSPAGGFTSEEPPEPDPQQLVSAIPAGATSLKDSRGHAKVRTRYGLLDTELREVDLSSPLVKGMVTLDRGRTPEEAGEVVATHAFLKTSGLFVGSQFTPRGSSTWYRIVGAYELPSDLDKNEVIAPPGTLLTPLDKELRAAGVPGVVADDAYLVRTGPEGFTWNMVKAANTKGVLVRSRVVTLNPPAPSDVPLYAQMESSDDGTPELPGSEMAVIATVFGLAMLEICLLAGPAFAVGARRSRRQLGLVGANGGDRRHIRAIVLSGGLVIGAAAAVLGTATGMLLTVALRPLLEEYVGVRFAGFDIRPLEIAGIALLAVVTGLLAAVVPAVSASRQTVLASLTGRRGIRRANRVLPFVGLAAVGLGAAIALLGTTGMGATVVVGGSALAELGLVALTPVLVGLFGRIGRRLPLSPRLALRDAVRNRGRTAPAVAAVMAAVAGTVAIAAYEHSSEAQARFEYVAQLPAGSGKVELHEPGHQKAMAAVREAVSRELPLAVRADVDHVRVGEPDCEQATRGSGCGRAEIIRPREQRCPLYEGPLRDDAFTAADRKALRRDWRCADSRHSTVYDAVVADEKLLTSLAVTDPGTVSALKSGRAVSFDRRDVKDGKVTLRLVSAEADRAVTGPGEDPRGEDKVFAVHQAPQGVEGYGITLVLPPSAARAAGLATEPYASYFVLDGTAGDRQRQQLAAQIDRIGVDAPVLIESGYQGGDDMALLALTVFAGLVTLGAAGIATGLAQTDAEADLKTLSAVGAAPRVRRAFSGFQCGLVAAMGVVLGSLSGILPAVGLRLYQRRETEHLLETSGGPGEVVYVPIVLPWETLGALLVLVPLGAALLAALVTRSGGGFARRAAA
ncbi:FtsX-like permease family protein [Streptomyces sp. NPDC127106]|uniref:FtsX-like permease family protein n=1 Tax=Streptomyces sp. NPDC127106 TaxID=3345360 RepID=UPI00362B04E0